MYAMLFINNGDRIKKHVSKLSCCINQGNKHSELYQVTVRGSRKVGLEQSKGVGLAELLYQEIYLIFP